MRSFSALLTELSADCRMEVLRFVLVNDTLKKIILGNKLNICAFVKALSSPNAEHGGFIRFGSGPEAAALRQAGSGSFCSIFHNSRNMKEPRLAATDEIVRRQAWRCCLKTALKTHPRKCLRGCAGRPNRRTSRLSERPVIFGGESPTLCIFVSAQDL